ncbi:hypothetical protein JW613_05550 [Streptomyces smyrnaeus]|uniref:Nucleoside 2-deoxyribosyltransferase n=1 Tax=Streptomyces smyrnaeus TaxID=1387713 RepID=A0ABS3XS11_9ACTN|nr:hypothetical protein [Streptomyces smyrnaeus]
METQRQPGDAVSQGANVRTCFVIGPIGDAHAPHNSDEHRAWEDHLRIFEKVIVPACARFEIEALRADRISRAGDINEQICRYVLQADLVIADVSGGNPNVMYELGLRHITGKPTIHIGEYGQLPFDIAPIRTIRYNRSLSGFADARAEIEGTLADGLQEGFDLLTPARVLRGVQTTDVVRSSGSGETDQADDAPGLLDDFAAIEVGLEAMAGDMDAITAAIEAIAAMTEQFAPEFEKLNQSNAPMSARLSLVHQYGKGLSAPAENMDRSAQAFSRRMVTLDSGVRAALGLIEATPPDERDEGAAEFLEQLVDLAQSAQGGLEGLTVFGGAAEELGGLSRNLRVPIKRIGSAIKRVTSAMTCIDEWASTARALVSEPTPDLSCASE